MTSKQTMPVVGEQRAGRGADASPPSPLDTRSGRVGVLLLNLGTPDATDYWSMRRYLKEFLSDRRVIEVSRIVWLPILQLAILPFRPGRKGKDYDKIWNRERNESPLKTITRSQSEKLSAALAGAGVVVDWAMRYGNPSTASRIVSLLKEGCDRILLVPLYPQYAAATTASACDQAFRALMKVRRQPAIRVVPPYYADPAYIGALVKSIRGHLAELDYTPDALIVSFHGMPERYRELGDPYYDQCRQTSRLVREKLGWPEDRWYLTFQSRFGNAPWLQPYTIETVERLASDGMRNVVLVAPGFAADCLETLEELNMENRAVFLAHGGERFSYIACLNDGAEGMSVIEQIVRRELRGWVEDE
jgi:ferrochelatase